MKAGEHLKRFLINSFFFFLIKRLEFEWLLREHVPKVLIQLGNILQVNLNSNTPPASPCSHFV